MIVHADGHTDDKYIPRRGGRDRHKKAYGSFAVRTAVVRPTMLC